MPGKVHILTSQRSEALAYVLDFVFNRFYGCGYRISMHLSDVQPDDVVISYGGEKHPDGLHIASTGYIFKKDLHPFPQPELTWYEGLPVIYRSGGVMGFDLFTAIFFLLSRAEEYSNDQRDMHGRFRAEYSLFPREFVSRPVIDEWLCYFRDRFLADKPLALKPRAFRWVNTYDIDVAYAFKHRPLTRMVAGSLKNLYRLDFHAFRKRLKVLFSGDADPFDTYDFQAEISRAHDAETIYFFLLGDKDQYDRNLSAKHPGMQNLIRQVRAYATVGIHPSYASLGKPEKIGMEIGRLANILNEKVTCSRQHFLRFSLPDTYQHLIREGIRSDYSMGYADFPGFRAGTCTPHRFFDLKAGKTTELEIYPLTLMDATLRDYQYLSSSLATQQIRDLIDRVRAVKGTFISLWHNDTLQDKPANVWRQQYLEMAMYASRQS